MLKLGIAYSVTGNYVLKTLPSLVSVLENNRNCGVEESVDITVFFYILNKVDQQIIELKKVCDRYGVLLEIFDSQAYIDILEEVGDEAYNDSLVIDLYVIAPSILDVDYNVLFLQSDVVMNHGHTLMYLAKYDFEGGRKSCASTIDMQSSPMIKQVIPLPKDQHLFNVGVFLSSPKLYKEHNTFGQYVESIKERGWKFYPYWNVLRSGYGLRNEVCILPVRYQIYPGQKMLKVSHWKKIFALDNKEYYSDRELEEALVDPVFVHYINFIVRKPWYDDLPKKFKKVGYWPYQDLWNYYADLLGNREDLVEPWNMTSMEKIKRFFFDYLRGLYIPLCTYFYKKETMRRNNIINGLSDESQKGDFIMNIAVGKLLGNIAGSLHLYEFCSKIGIEAMFYRMCYRKELKTSDLFYGHNEVRIQNNANMFAEEKSKNTYLKAIAFRRSHKLKDRPQFCKDEEYFNHLTKLKSDEVLVDCGAYTGDTVAEFVSYTQGHYKKIIAFEPDHDNFLKLYDLCSGKRDCFCIEAGVWNENGDVSFEGGKLAGSRIDIGGGGIIRTLTLDQCAECQDVTFIKMDIEGAELKALCGARQVILRNRPILTICLYHTDEDMLSIPEWMRENLVDYKYYCRHHFYYKEETIIYAIPFERCVDTDW